ncbi:hypothetical protein CXF46_07460 [Corynebacterium bovis]|nr:hypothetical protein CXF29_08435 [Corynebacterium bovis]RRQ15426.1 hypothetical protein CXF46_07460 [Corynebacterium bovis]
MTTGTAGAPGQTNTGAVETADADRKHRLTCEVVSSVGGVYIYRSQRDRHRLRLQRDAVRTGGRTTALTIQHPIFFGAVNWVFIWGLLCCHRVL